MTEPIRIAHIIGKWLGGGVESVVMNYYRHINKEEFQFDFICDNDSTNIPYQEIEALGGRVLLVPPYQDLINYQKALQKIFKEYNYQIVHSHINTLSIFPLFIAKNSGIPIRIAHSHSTTNPKEWKKNLLKQVLKPFSKKFSTHYFCCSELAGRWLFGNKAYDNKQVYLLNNAIDLEKFQYNPKTRLAIRQELHLSDDTLIIGHIGRFVTQKNHNFLIEVFNNIQLTNPNTKLILIGQGPLEDEIKSKVKVLNLEDKVLFLGQRTDVHLFYQAFDFFLFPSLYEGLGMVLIEAQTSGLPCLTSTNVPQVAQVTSNLDFLDLQSGADIWSQQVFQKLPSHRRDHSSEVQNHGYDILKETKHLEKKYKELLKSLN